MKAAVKTVTKFGKATWNMFLRDSMVAAMDKVLDISNHIVHPLEVRNINTGRPSTCFDGDVSASRIFDTGKATQTIGGNSTARFYILLGPVNDRPNGASP